VSRTYFFKPSARVRCGYCTKRLLVESTHEIDADSDHIDEAESMIVDAIEAQMEEDGWHDGNCPGCLTNHGAEIAAQVDADADHGWEEGEEDAA